MVEVFKTNVNELQQADILLAEINKQFSEYKVNFDLEDCDKILRVESISAPIQSDLMMSLLNELGFNAELLPD